MYKQGNILYIKNFLFDNGKRKDTGKFLIILSGQNCTSIYITLTSSQDHIPEQFKKSGCINITKNMISCFCIKANEEICNNDFKFSLDF